MSQWESASVWLNELTLVLLEIFCHKWQKLNFDQLKPKEEINGLCYQITSRAGVWPQRLLEPQAGIPLEAPGFLVLPVFASLLDFYRKTFSVMLVPEASRLTYLLSFSIKQKGTLIC